MTRILIADDHDVVRSGLRTILSEREGWEIAAEVRTGPEAVEQTLAIQPDIAILDYALPLMNGIEATRRIRTGSPRTEVLIFTMHDREGLILELLQAGARGYLLKSDPRESVTTAVDTLARHKPFFTGIVSEALLASFLAHGQPGNGLLTARERNVVQLITEGNSNKQISDALQITVKTVETHRAAAMRKLNVRNSIGLTRYAIRNKWMEP